MLLEAPEEEPPQPLGEPGRCLRAPGERRAALPGALRRSWPCSSPTRGGFFVASEPLDPRLPPDTRSCSQRGQFLESSRGLLLVSASVVIDDWGLAPPTDQERRDLLEILEDRYGLRSTIMTSQVPTTKWHDHLGDPTIADAVCERILHNAHRLALKGPSRRKEEGVKE
jgi:hypothetical protein